MADEQSPALTDQQLVSLFHEPKADLSLLTPDEQQRLVKLTEPQQSKTPSAPQGGLGQTYKDLGIGIAKRAGESIAGLGDMAGSIPNIFNPAGGTLRDAVDTLYNKPGLSKAAFTAVPDITKASNPAQDVGRGVEAVGEAALPLLKGAQAIPSAARAGATMENILSAAKDVPIDMSGPGNAALRVAELASHGGGTELGPGPVRQFIQYATNPKKPPMTYKVGQEFVSNLSRLSADEAQKLTPVIKREVGQMTDALRQSLTGAADTVGMGKDYTGAVSEYAKAMGLRDMGKDVAQKVITGAGNALPLAGGGAAAYWLYKKLMGGGS